MAAVLSLCLIGILVCQTNETAQAVNVQADCSLTANVAPDLADKPDNLYYKLYKVADATPQGSSDAYTFQTLPAFSAISGTVNGLTDLASPDFESISQSAARIVATASTPIAPAGNTPVRAGERAQGFTAGLYLVVAYGSDAVTDASAQANVLTQVGGKYVSTAYSATKEFTFAPELIALPTKDPVNGVINSANPGEWIYNAQATLKPTITDRIGSLEIVKELLSNEQVDGVAKEATFVFDIKGYTDEAHADLVYTNVASIVFGAAGKQSVVIEGIPVGLHVEVTEVYTGTSYELAGPAQQETVIHATDNVIGALAPASVTFSNTYNAGANHGGSVLNSFQFENGGWEWSKDGERQQA